MAGNQTSGQSGTFSIGNPPVLINPTIGKKFKTNSAGSNIQPGAVLVIGTQTWPLTLNEFGTRFVVGKAVLSSPGGLRIRAVAPAGSPVTVIIRNPSGIQSAPTTLIAQ
jgi:hypothetical protein